MKIIHVVGLISPQGEYGGPTRVAIEHATALTHLGHDVTIAAGTRGYDTPPNNINGVPTKLFRAHTPSRHGSLRALAAPELAIWLHTAAKNADIVHIHLGRDFVTMPAALAMRGTKTPYVLQTHGMVMPTHKTPIHALDKISTLPALRHASRILYLTPEERDGLINLDANINIEFLRNGIHTLSLIHI